VCFSYLGPVCLFCVFFVCVFGLLSLVCFEFSVPVQVIPVKTCLQDDLLFVEWDEKLYSLTYSDSLFLYEKFVLVYL